MNFKFRILFLLLLFLALPAWAGQGWYLMTPQDLSAIIIIDTSNHSAIETLWDSFSHQQTSPINMWSQVAAYDSAKECEVSRKQTKNKVADGMNKDKDKTPEYEKEKLIWLNYVKALCIASDDPRLK